MAQGIQFTSYIPTSLVGNNSPSPSLAAEIVTGLPIWTGAFPGNVFYLTEQQANQLSQSTVNSAPALRCHAGWYMVVQVDSGATVANITAGAIGAQARIPNTQAAEIASIPPASVVTDGATAAAVGTLGINPVIFLNAVSVNNYTIVQIAGDAKVLLAASQTTVVGDVLLSQTPGNATAGGSTALTAHNIQNVVGVAEEVRITPAAALVLTQVAASSGGSAVYTGTITGGGTNNFVGLEFTVAGFVNASNNGLFVITANTTTTFTASNASAIAETHAGTATSRNLVRVNVAFPFGII